MSLDFPIRKGTLPLLAELDAIVADHGGRIYLAKDARMDREMLRCGYPKLRRFIEVRDEIGAGRRFSSNLAGRLDI